MIRLTTGEVRVGGVCDSGKFIYLSGFKYCVSACPTGMTHQVKYIDGNIWCTTECDSGDSTMLDDSTICIRPDCASVDGLKHYGPVSDKKCVSTCQQDYKYEYNTSFCQDSCPDFMEPTSNNLHATNETGTCVATCASNKYQLRDTTLTYPVTGNPVKKYCLDSCDQGSYTRYWDNGSTKHCTDTCDSTSANTGIPQEFGYYTNVSGGVDTCTEECTGATNFIHSVVNFNVATESGECILNCPTSKYQLRDTTLTYPVTGNPVKKYCLDSCDQGSYTRYWDNGSTKHCTDTCLSESATTGIPSTYRYYTNNGTGLSTCSEKCTTPKEFISSINNFDTSTEYGECVSTCGTADGYQLIETVFLYGDSSQKKYCDTDCNRAHSSTTFNRIYENDSGSFYQCTNSCDPQVTTTSKPVTKNYENLSGGKTWCITTCANFHDITDIATLNTANNSGVCTADCGAQFYFNEPWGSSMWYCVEAPCPAIQPFYFINSVNSRKTCINVCPSDLPFKDPADNQCIASCHPTYPYQDDSNNCLMNCHAPYLFIDSFDCISKCPLTKPFYTLQGQEFICDAQCNAGNLIHVDISGFFSLEELVEAEPRSECSLSCSKFKFESDLTFSGTTMNKNYCIPSCPIGFYSVDDPSDKRCVSHCNPESAYKYATPDLKCVIDCIENGYLFFNEDLTCSNSCSKLIDMSVACVSTCPTERRYNSDSHCVSECPLDKPFLLDYSTCISKCPLKFYEKICVDDCEAERLKGYYAQNKLVFSERNFILSTGECSSRCSESNYPFINENTLECISNCPPACDGSICTYPKMRLKDEKMFCREACTDSDFPFKDEKGLECLQKCKPERPFFEGPEKKCVSQCSPDYPFALKKNNCDSNECSEDCNDFELECVQKCTPTKRFTIKREYYTECVCNCPEFFLPNNDLVCELSCDASLGLVDNALGNSCEHCFRDRGEQFMLDGRCVQKCPEGYAFNLNYVCKKCIDLNLWTNDKLRCIPIQFCDPLSKFDFTKKTCTKCSGEGYMLKYEYPNNIACTKTDCTEGHIEEENNFSSCYVCPNKEKQLFYSEKECISSCPEKLTYELFKFTCAQSCSGHCSTSCCKNGKCFGSVCQCNEGYFGTRCDYKIENINHIFSEIINFLLNRFNSSALDINALEVMIDLQRSLEITNKRLLNTKQNEIKEFISKALAYLENIRVQYAYQPMILTLLDGLLGISSKFTDLYSDKQFFDLSLSIIDTITAEIQEFNTTLSIIPEFEIVTEAYFKGSNFSFKFGPDISNNDEIEFSTCAGKIRNSLDLDFTTPLSYFYLTFSSEISSKIQRKADQNLLVGEIPRKEVAIFTKKGQTNINAVCAENYIDLNFEIELDNDSSEESVQKFKSTNVNLFNKNDPFFVDKCRPFTDENGKDLTLGKRKETFFLDPKELCNETKFQVCEVEQKETGFECKCKGIQSKKKSSLESVAASYPDTNYILFTCWDVFREISLFENYGFYAIFMPFIFSILLSFYAMNRMNKKLNSNKRFEYIRINLGFFDPKTMNKEIYFKECAIVKQLVMDPSFVREIKYFIREEAVLAAAAVPTIKDLENLEAKDLIKYDQRSAFIHAIDTLRSEHSFFSTFSIGSPLNPQVYTILLYCTELNLAVMLNAFFIEDSLVDNKNESDGGGLFDSFRDELPKTIWALVTTKIIMLLVTFFYRIDYEKAKKMELRLTAKEGGIAMRGFDNYMNSQRLRLILFILVILVVNFILGYFVVIYVYVYANSKDIWVNGIIMGLIVDNLIVEMFGAFVLIFTREIAKTFPSVNWIYDLGVMLSRLKNFNLG